MIAGLLIAATYLVLGAVFAYCWLAGQMRAAERAENADLDAELRELIRTST